MKFAVTVLASILFACSVTTAIPVNPSATTSAEASTLVVIPSSKTTLSVDFSKPSKEDIALIKEYVLVKKDRDDAEEMHESIQLERLAQQELVKRLEEELSRLLGRSQSSKNPLKYGEKRKKLEQKLKQERENLDELTGKLWNSDYSILNRRLGGIKIKLVKNLTGKILYRPTSHYLRFLESEPKFMELISTFGNSTPSQQPESEQASTSGTQNQLQHHKSPSPSSSETSTVSVQPTQTSSST
ncbi:hypothetical protein BDEG_24638 [Batrachochytrium dendrobatidis JEL423]|uniref:Uncharacterized protein n=1 Tax=Batrachochytrium dendrobatidis (strain JEL423) TaxID=403673 RepID=A0A177WLI7_BATDL|nr:hypothetical protein BDEG_24638 [Batrachochytrium dendrobatidis JEL423]